MPAPSSIPLLKTPAQVRAELEKRGISISEWARVHGFQRMTVVDVLRGTRKGRRGEAHRVAVALGLKDGMVEDAKDFCPLPGKKTLTAGPAANSRAKVAA